MADSALLKDVSPAQLESFVRLVVLVAYADGDLCDKEEQVLVDAVQKLSAGRVDLAHLKELMVELPPLSRASNNWRAEQILRLRGDLTEPQLRLEVFRLALSVARADDKIGLRESRMLVNLVKELSIDPEAAKKMLEAAE